MSASNEAARAMTVSPACPPEPPGRSSIEMLVALGLVGLAIGAAAWAGRRWKNRRDELSLQGTRRPRPANPPPPAA